jgi:hypothetical protein
MVQSLGMKNLIKEYVKSLQDLKQEWNIHLAENSYLEDTYWYKQKQVALAWVDVKIAFWSAFI